LIGSVLAAFNCRLLKKVLNEKRPGGAIKVDPGMPSSHAQSLAFLAVSAALGIYEGGSHVAAGETWKMLASFVPPLLGGVGAAIRDTSSVSLPPLLAILVVTFAIFLTWLRVKLGYHTTPQVVVGFGLGSSSALAWRYLGRTFVLPVVAADPRLTGALWCTMGLATLAFTIKTARGWYAEKQRTLAVLGEEHS